MKKNKPTITIGIPAYQSEKNIVSLLNSLLEQKEVEATIEKILVYTDGCSDKTAEKVSSIKNNKIKLFIGKENKGYAYSLQFLISNSSSDIFVALNDDIKIKSSNIIAHLTKPILTDSKIGLVGGNVCALPPKSFIGRCIYTSYLVFLPIKLNYRKGLTRLTNDGKIMAMTRRFSKSLDLSHKSVGNVDIYIYLKNLAAKNRYRFAREAKVYFRLPETIRDFRNQEIRVKKSFSITKNQFKDLAIEEWYVPKKLYIRSLLRVFIKYPIESIIFKLFINNVFLVTKEANFKNWEVALSTKQL